MIDFEIGELDHQTLFVEVILPLAIPKTYTYRVPAHLNSYAQQDRRAVVQFGKSKIYTAIIYKVSKLAPEKYEAKYLLDIIDDQPIVSETQIKFWHWIADYYLCTLGEVMAAALPSALKLASETRIILNLEHEFDRNLLNDKEFLILDALELRHELSINEITKILAQKSVFPLLKSLLEKKIIFISEEISEKYQPKRVAIIQLNDFYDDKENLKQLFEILERAPKQLDALLAYLKLKKEKTEIKKSDLLEAASVSSGIVKALIDKDIFIQKDKVISRFAEGDNSIPSDFILNDHQLKALKQIKESFIDKSVTLLHGITSSGKTQIYISLIEEYLEKGQQALYLLPEIALTGQMIERLQVYFGNQIIVYHSKFNDNERAEIWQKVLNNEVKIVLGARSSIFLPFSDLGLIIVDEEHEASFKQYDPAPRYNARDAAIVLGSLTNAKLLLGSATPALETYYNALNGKYGLVKLTIRYGGVKMPDIEVISISEERSRKLIKENFTSVLLQQIQEKLDKKEQVILFQNRRGYVPVLICKTCGNTPKCINCDVSLTYHKASGKLHCHYCGYKEENITECPACGSKHIEYKGLGTEKVEDDLKVILPEAKIARLDYDTTRNKNAHSIILNDFEDKKIDILVGTQMVAKGLDFDNVTLIGIINADSIIQFPDFRAYERSFQMLSQVAGRAGRRSKQGKVIIQTYDVKHRIIKQIVDNDYEGMYREEMIERKQFKYPPYHKIIHIDLKHKDLGKLLLMADNFGKLLRHHLGEMVLGPQSPLIGRIRNYYIQTIIIKMDWKNQSVTKIKSLIKEKIADFESDKINKGIFVQVDVDPY
ncbi:MAG: primosomal protein N' [Bacteroidetes bacterium]|nr:primosomal protein N' [Bacteroidota bacterium]MBU1371262.1 primosomal protein N' [Bacteroidota bacterium]MBU1485749.1 primosomal protein N' [Bacteroidota bacterium]MBU1759669.1 primosomal protein N' [Bacteroidota bacterium]MBU2269624.1 primosomal protein N' [Bacteroidota bacterium]